MMVYRNAHYWKDKEEREKKAVQHTEEMEEKFEKDIKNCVRTTKLYNDNLVVEPTKEEINIQVIDTDSVSAIFDFSTGKTAVLNFSSYKHPGGMFLKGSKAQEECLCHESFLYNVLKEWQFKFYDWNKNHKNKALYFNRALYLKDIVFIHNGKEKKCNVITCAAPNKFAAQKYCNVSNQENLKILKSRIEFILKIAKENNIDTLILGAYGCGVFGQNPEEVADTFKKYLNIYNFKNVIFAIPDKKDQNYRIFKKILK